jgi:hypothetical protein
MQHTTLPDNDTTCRTGDRGYLFGREFFPFHSLRTRQLPNAKQLNFEYSPHWPLPARKGGTFPYGAEVNLVVQDNTQEGFVDVDLAVVVLDEPQLPEFVHEKIDPRPGCADHLRQHLL